MENTAPGNATGLHGQVVGTIVTSLAEATQLDPGTIGEGSTLFDELGLDSTTVLGLLMAIEEELGIEFETDSLEQHHFESVGTLAAFVEVQVVEQVPDLAGA
ncbi:MULTISPECIES: acyl carrier protein [Thermomonosporaceae]|uniref:acyl carrier protein n=1 Tax=Thermomonosporaceae TaxID=2012 RepID=UPI00255B400A|nr:MULTISPECIES: acyl carrier protein [Thermomonosporaceae]MDL4774216.1 acyl carrier protein [Actinomadura xylanilytica]